MNGKDLLIGLGYISVQFFEEAETETLSKIPKSTTGKYVRRTSRPLRRTILVAAIIAMTLLLVGCAVVYAFRLQDMSIGQETYTQSFDASGRAIEPVEKTKDILTFYGRSGDSIQQALVEWYDFLETYDPEGNLMTNDPELPEIPDRYEYTYSCYTQEMVAKVDEIAKKYDLKLLDTWIPFQQYQANIFLEETGIGSFLLPDSGAEIRNMAGMLYPPYNFRMEFTLVPETGSTGLTSSVSYSRKDYFPRSFPGSGIDLSNFEQWDHVTRNGTQVLLALSNKGRAYILAETGNGLVYIDIDGNLSQSAYPDESQILSKEELETIANLFDYSMEPGEIDRAVIETRLEETEKAYRAENTYVPEVYGSFNDYLMNNYRRGNSKVQYTFYDLTGDGVDELLIGTNGAYSEWLTMRDGKVVSQLCGGVYLCEGPAIELSYRSNVYYDYEEHYYYATVSDTVIDDVDMQTGPKLASIIRKQDQWYWVTVENFRSIETPISAEEAQAVMDQYPRMELDWKPLTEYPLNADGYTLGDYTEEKDVRLSDTELLEVYREFLATEADDFYTHYRILDINGDGVDDLLLSGDGEHYWDVMTYRYGIMPTLFVADFYLCEDNVMVSISIDHQDNGVEVESQHFFRWNEFEQETLACIAYNKATASWQSDFYGTPMNEADAEAIIAKYPRIDQGMQLISELLN